MNRIVETIRRYQNTAAAILIYTPVCTLATVTNDVTIGKIFNYDVKLSTALIALSCLSVISVYGWERVVLPRIQMERALRQVES